MLKEDGTVAGAVTALWIVKTSEPLAENPDEVPTYRIVLGGTNGIIKVLDEALETVSQFGLYGKINYGLAPLGQVRGFKSICVDKAGRKILYGTAGGEIGEIEMATGADVNVAEDGSGGGPVISAHFREQLHGLAAHPFRQECITAGDDKVLRVWNMESHALASFIELPDIARTAVYSPNGQIIVVGLGGKVSRKPPTLVVSPPGAKAAPVEEVTAPGVRPFAGQVVVLSFLQNELRIVYTTQDASDDITCVLFSPDGHYLYASSRDTDIYVYDAFDNFKLTSKLAGDHTEGVKSMDITSDGSFILSVGLTTEVVLWDVASCCSIPEDSRMEVLSSVEWFVRQCTFGIDSVGAFAEFGCSDDLVSLCQSKKFVDSYALTAVGDRYGGLSLLRCPFAKPGAPMKRYSGHTPGGVAKVVFTVGDQYLLSIGRDDKTMMQWRVVEGVASPPPPPQAVFAKRKVVAPVTSNLVMSPKTGGFESSFVVDRVDFLPGVQVGRGQRPLGVRLNSIVGIGARNGNPQAKYCGMGSILGSFNRTVFSLCSDRTSQLSWESPPSFTSSSGDVQEISSLVVSICTRFVLVGGKGIKMHVDSVSVGSLAVFNATSGRMLIQLADDIVGGVVAAAFSVDGMICACLAGDAVNSLHLFARTDPLADWTDASLISTVQSSLKPTRMISFLFKSMGSENEYDFVTAGTDMTFWTLRGRNFVGEICAPEVNAEAVAGISAIVGLKFTGQSTVTGHADGSLWHWVGKTPSLLFAQKHNGPVTALATNFVSSNLNFPMRSCSLVTASHDGVNVFCLTSDGSMCTTIKLLQSFSLKALLERVDRAPYLTPATSVSQLTGVVSLTGALDTGFVTTLSVDADLRRILVCLSSGIVVELAPDSGSATLVIEGCPAGATVIAAHPTEPNTIMTASNDRVLRLWSVLQTSNQPRGLVSALQIPHIPSSAVFKDDACVAVAMGGSADTYASILIVGLGARNEPRPVDVLPGFQMDREMKITLTLQNVGMGRITQLRYSLPKTKGSVTSILAATSEDGCVYLYGAGFGNTYSALGSVLVDQSRYPVYGLDFSVDGRFFRTFSRTFDSDAAVDVRFFDLSQTEEGSADEEKRKVLASEVKTTETLHLLAQSVAWASVSSPAAPEVHAVNQRGAWILLGNGSGYTQALNSPIHISTQPNAPYTSGNLVACGYNDGTFNIFRNPCKSVPLPGIGVVTAAAVSGMRNLHSPAAIGGAGVLTTFTAAENVFCTVGADDGSILLWEVV